MILHPKVLAHKLKSKSIDTRAVSVNEYGQLEDFAASLDKRVVKGYLIIWNKRNLYGEKFIKGCAAKTIQEWGPGSNSNYKTKFMYQHNPEESLALFDVLKEDDQGLYFETKVLDPVPCADRTLIQLRSGTLNNFSQGFNPVWDKAEYDEMDDSIVFKEIKLFEGSVVSIPVDMNTYTIRSVESMESLIDETEYFVGQLPRKFQMEARGLFSRHKTLADLQEPTVPTPPTLQEPTKPDATGTVSYKNLLTAIGG